MTRYHISSSTGDAKFCSANKRACPYGDEANHYDSIEGARSAFESSHKSFKEISITKETLSITAETTVKQIEAKYPGVELDLRESHGGYHVISGIKVPKGSQKIGMGTAVMEELITIADARSWKLALTPTTDWGATSTARLKKFYKRFGFVENRGRHKDFTTSESMVRPLSQNYLP